jgi:hypothetical protein
MSNEMSVIISALALVVSLASLLITWRMSRRTINAQKVTAWIELESRTGEWFLANLSVKNQSHLDIKIQKVAIGLPDFRLADLNEALVQSGSGELHLPTQITIKNFYSAMPLLLDVGAGETGKAKFLVHQPAHSRRRATRVSVMYWTMEPSQKWRILQVSVKTRADL